MRRVLTELADSVYNDLEESLDLRRKGQHYVQIYEIIHTRTFIETCIIIPK